MTEATAPPRVQFELSMSARVAMALAAALTIPLALPSALALPETAEQVGYVVGALSITIAGPLLVGWISFRRNPGADVTRVVVITALVLVVVRVLPALAVLEANVTPAADGEPASGPRAALHEAQREFDAARIGGDDQASMRAAGKAIDAFGAIADGDGRESMVWFGQRVRAVQAQHESFNRRLEAFLAGVDQPAEFDTAAEIDARIEQLRVAHEEGMVLVAAIKAFPVEVESRLGDPADLEHLAAFQRGFRKHGAIGLQLRECEVRFLEGYRELLTLLRTHIGQWTMDQERGIAFTQAVSDDQRAAIDHTFAILEREQVEMQRLDALFRLP